MPLPRHESPEAAALDGFPPGAVRVVATRAHGDDAYVLLDTRPAGPPYLYGVECMRDAGGWVEGSSSNGGGWRVTDADAELGTLVAWDQAPAGADRVRVALGADVHEEPVEYGVFLSAWWRVPPPAGVWPRAVAFRIAGRWVEAR
ncbi:MAG TPA: hypothetical protein VJ802_14770 [Gemmatimonadaceae bacterium]|nr:hypothetical protein [Gemmatimonadaceae bacterium]